MRVKVLFFGLLKDVAGRPEEELDLPPGSQLRSVFEHYAERFPRVREMAESIVLARNHEFAALSTPISEGDEVALLPPVSGGAPRSKREIAEAGNYFSLIRQQMDTRAIVARILNGAEGAVVTF